ncbi:MAG: hypothetical protein JXQ76_06015 [Campylobacterales bacterium]|nr:hypothetical protein [Campylobacterales bacterium]
MVKILILIASLFLSGCTQSGYFTSVTKTTIDKPKEIVVIKDILELLPKYYAPAKTTFFINPELSKDNLNFATTLDTYFRKKGYGISRDTINSSIPFAWKIDDVGNYLRVTYHIQEVTITRFYIQQSQSKNVVPFGSFSIIGAKR